MLLTLALGALAANFLLQDNGYVLINFRGYLIEMSVPIMLFLLLLAYLAVRLLIRLWQAPRRLGELAARRRTRKAGEFITRGYIELGQGNFARGEKLLTRGARNSETPLLNYLAAARAAQAQGDTSRRDNWLAMAADQEPRARETIALTRAELQLASKETAAARHTLDELLKLSPRNPEALRLKAGLCAAADDWHELERLLPLLRKHARVAPEVLDDWTIKAWTGLLSETEPDESRIRQLLKALPRSLRAHPQIVAAHSQARIALGDAGRAESLLRSALPQSWDPALLALYSEPGVGDAVKRLRRVENWLQERPQDPELLLCAARLCVLNELWGKARSYYESSAGLHPAPQTYHELGQLLLRTGEQQQAFDAFQQALGQAAGLSSPVRRLTAGGLTAD